MWDRNRWLMMLCAGLMIASLCVGLVPLIWAADDSSAGLPEFDTLLSAWVKAKAAGDAKLIAGFLSEEFIGVGPAGRGEDKRAFVQHYANPNIVVQEANGRDQTTRFYGKTVVVTGVYEIKGTSSGKDISGDYRYVDVWSKTVGDQWRIIASTLSKVRDD
jgi:ketosteroid isomerase-like protein